MEQPQEPGTAPTAPQLFVDPWRFVRRLAIVTLSVLLFLLIVVILRAGQAILQPLFIAAFLGYLIVPAHEWLVRQRVPAVLAYPVLLIFALAILVALGDMVFASIEQVVERLPAYEKRLDDMVNDALDRFSIEFPGMDRFHVRELPIFQSTSAGDQLLAAVLAAVGTFRGFFTGAAVAFIYLIFLMAEKATLPRRLVLAFGDAEGKRVLAIVGVINQAISEYLAIKTFISFLAGVLSLVVLWSLGVDFYVMWALFIFLFNYIPYLGSLVAVVFPVVLSFVQLDMERALVVAGLLIGIQVVLGNFVEPRMAGRRLGVSPLLILLSLSFWGLLWGIVGMILAVPLLVIVKIVLSNIPETKPLATLMSNL
jgi:predicted PurR-regulated permease PerM